MKTFLAVVSSAGILLGLAGGTVAQAQTAPVYPMARVSGHVHANGRCHGLSYGTGARSCGTATGGPSGGLSNRN